MSSLRTVLNAQGLWCVRAGHTVLQDVDVSLRTQEWVAVVGPNGAGKSTLLKVLGGLQTFTRGSLTWGERPANTWQLQERARWLAWMSQHNGLHAEWGELTVHETVRLGRLSHLGLLETLRPCDEQAVAWAMTQTQVEHLKDRRLHELSAGEAQRVLLARTLAVRAHVLLLDEPISHLDPPHQRAQVHLWQQEVKEGRTVVTVLHDLSTALRADRLVVMQSGRVVMQGSPHDAHLRDALHDVFDGAFAIQAAEVDGQPRWIALGR